MATNNAANAEEERAQVAREMAGIDVLLRGGGASVDELERALQRKAALGLRAQALDSRIAVERARAAQEAAEKWALEDRRLTADAEKKLAALVEPLLIARDRAREADAAARRAPGAIIAQRQARAAADSLERLIVSTWPALFDLTVTPAGHVGAVEKKRG